MQLTLADIHFDHLIKTKEDALTHIVGILTDAGHTQPAYLQGMRDREEQISTYLGNGIAIPHGTPQSRDAVLKTGVKVLACPQGVDWGEAQTAYLIVGIAAQDNEHLDILRQLTHALGDDRVPEALSRAENAQAVLDILAGEITPAEGDVVEPPPVFDEDATFTLRNPHGLHARPSAVLVKAVKQWQSQIRVENLDTQSPIVDAKNLMRVVSLGAKQGHRLHFMASGDDAHQALRAIGSAFDAGLGEIAAQPQQGIQPIEKDRRSWLSRLFS
ncbi:TPA: HPr family phosphocarrier protein [Kluyvera ascorbata F0526]|jgi:phosphocarrier protein|uniref:HPr family phosphocarrier protein n=1 Tax=Kluyvera ascorbata TaxID=51288 RepID=A0AB35XEK4_9ENTR|nr:HPr family phosphocarrier protein [Kluyvera ascorbata]BBV64190.1 PTS fructose transporter subunit IIA [Klebsiella sp. STW0522-44]HEB4872716.1 HPr family phosphocarrier protein [Kluyvera ascorbata F0526]MDU3911239.1 HPr family phosphocarrier protein [Kluyvera ascorbata]HAT7512824.1 HPr family phosphocarrier protein [Kluyvera ascorbata]HCL5620075.1 HPr family phosphocarrier protein [Kluyvera ascorbata]